MYLVLLKINIKHQQLNNTINEKISEHLSLTDNVMQELLYLINPFAL